MPEDQAESKTGILGTEDMPYDPENPVHKAISSAEDVISAAEKQIGAVTLDMVYDAVKELTVQTTEMAKQIKVMNEAQAKWIKAGKF